jgi:hypothetical protein
MSSQDSVRKSDCGCQFCASHVAIKESFLMWSSSYQVGSWSNLSISTPDSKFPVRYKTASAARYRALSKPLCIPILTKFAVYDKLSWMSQAMFLQKNVTLALALSRDHLGDRCQVMQSRIFPDACVVGVSGCAH